MFCKMLGRGRGDGLVQAASANRSAVSLGRLESGLLAVIELIAEPNVWVGKIVGLPSFECL